MEICEGIGNGNDEIATEIQVLGSGMRLEALVDYDSGERASYQINTTNLFPEFSDCFRFCRRVCTWGMIWINLDFCWIGLEFPQVSISRSSSISASVRSKHILSHCSNVQTSSLTFDGADEYFLTRKYLWKCLGLKRHKPEMFELFLYLPLWVFTSSHQSKA